MKRHFFFYPFVALVTIAACFALFFFPRRRMKIVAGLNAFPGENHFANVRQLTFGGTNAEAYFSIDDKFLTFQHQGQFYDPQTHENVGPAIPCDQIYTMPVPAPSEPGEMKMLSNGRGRTTCSYVFPAGDRML